MTGSGLLFLNLNVKPLSIEKVWVSAGRGVRPQSVTTSWQSVTRSQELSRKLVSRSVYAVIHQTDQAVRVCSTSSHLASIPEIFSCWVIFWTWSTWILLKLVRDSLQMAGGRTSQVWNVLKGQEIVWPPQVAEIKYVLHYVESSQSCQSDGDLILDKCYRWSPLSTKIDPSWDWWL